MPQVPVPLTRKALLQTPEISSCSMRDTLVLRLACEEIVMNVTSYAYPEQSDGYLDVAIDKSDNRVVMCFKDGGVPFNPLAPMILPSSIHSSNSLIPSGAATSAVIAAAASIAAIRRCESMNSKSSCKFYRMFYE